MQSISDQLLIVTRQFLTELKSQRAARIVNLDANLEKELGIGSLEKAELFSRIEKQFEVTLSEAAIREVKTLRDLALVIAEAKPTLQKITHEFAQTLEAAQADPSYANTLIDVLLTYAEKEPDRPHIYFQTEEGDEITFTYGELLQNAKHVAGGIRSLNIQPGETVAMMMPTCLEFCAAFFGVLLAGCIPVPIYPPLRPDQIEEYVEKQSAILKNSQTRLLISFQRVKKVSNLLKDLIPDLKTVATVSDLSRSEPIESTPTIDQHSPALIQYTSGSTGDPKGVLLSHFNVLSNIRGYGKRIGIVSTDVTVSWLPLYHDMGLIGAWLGSFYFGVPLVLMSPLTFLTHPERWLWAMHYHRGTLSASPNFGYEMCVKKLDQKQLAGLDLSAWRIAANGAEAVNPHTLTRFYQKFSQYGFKKEALYPAYGLAESTVGLTLPEPGNGFHIDVVARDVFVKSQRAESVPENYQPQLQFVSCGKPMPEHEVRVVDENQTALPERCVGELQFKGPSMMQGYYRNREKTEAAMHDGWFETGDYAYIAQGDVYITGRKKDLIIKAGRNFYPDDIEIAIGEIKAVSEGRVAAFGIYDQVKGTEEFIIVAETDINKTSKKEELIAQITNLVLEKIGIAPDVVMLTPLETIPKTSSGKLRRDACKQLYLQNALEKSSASVWYQILKLYCAGIISKIKAGVSKTAQLLYTLYCMIIVLLFFPVALLTNLCLPTKKLIRKTNRFIARSAFYLVGNPLCIKDKHYLTQHRPMIYVMNHASYIDFAIAVAVLPEHTVFVGKKEILQMPFIGWLMKKSGNITVDRFDFSKGKEDLTRIQESVQDNFSLAIFPEGTFTYAAGIRPFKLGAFQIAAETNTPVCPIAITGNRQFLRANTWLFRYRRLQITVCKPIAPCGKTLADVSQLQNAAREAIVAHSDEQALNLMSANILE